jgi:4-amino-4-deoxy-L-arabinose transferase-like glycosyltransferase
VIGQPATGPRGRILAALLLVSSAAYFIGLGASSLWDANEAFYAETPREMMEAGDYLNPSFNYLPRFNKPPLSYWIVALSYSVMGVSETAERIPMAVAAVIMIATAFLLGRLVGWTGGGLIAALVLATTPRFLMFARRIMIDVYLAMFMGLCLLFFALAEARPAHRRKFLMLMFVAIGLGALTKGPVAIGLPALAFGAYLVTTRRIRTYLTADLLLGAAIVLAIVAPYYVALYQQHGWRYIEMFFVGENVGRFLEPMGGTPRRNIFFYVPVLFGDMYPWSLFLPAAVWLLLKRDRTGSLQTGDGAPRSRSGEPNLIRLLIAWIATFVVFFSFSQNKQDLYILPTVPATAALIGALLGPVFLGGAVPGGWIRKTMVLVAGAQVAAGIVALRLFAWGEPSYRLAGADAVGICAIAGGGAALWLTARRREFAALAAVAGALVVMNWVFVLRVLPDFERYKPVRPFAALVAREAPLDAIVGSYRFAVPSLAYYTRRHIRELNERQDLIEAFSAGKPAYFVITRQDYEQVKASLPGETYVRAQAPNFDVKFENVLDRDAPPMMLLVSNRAP